MSKVGKLNRLKELLVIKWSNLHAYLQQDGALPHYPTHFIHFLKRHCPQPCIGRRALNERLPRSVLFIIRNLHL